MMGRLVFRNDDEKRRARKMGVTDLGRKYTLHELAGGNVMFCATGVTDGAMLRGVSRLPNWRADQLGGHALPDRHPAHDRGRARLCPRTRAGRHVTRCGVVELRNPPLLPAPLRPCGAERGHHRTCPFFVSSPRGEERAGVRRGRVLPSPIA